MTVAEGNRNIFSIETWDTEFEKDPTKKKYRLFPQDMSYTPPI